MRGELMRFMGLAAMMAMTLVATAVPAMARGDQAAERAADQAQNAVREAERVLNETQNAEQQDADRTVVRDQEKGAVPKSGGISIGNVVLLALGGSALITGVWIFSRRAPW